MSATRAGGGHPVPPTLVGGCGGRALCLLSAVNLNSSVPSASRWLINLTGQRLSELRFCGAVRPSWWEAASEPVLFWVLGHCLPLLATWGEATVPGLEFWGGAHSVGPRAPCGQAHPGGRQGPQPMQPVSHPGRRTQARCSVCPPRSLPLSLLLLSADGPLPQVLPGAGCSKTGAQPCSSAGQVFKVQRALGHTQATGGQRSSSPSSPSLHQN